MRTISVTTDVYAAIWAARLPGEDTENDTLARILGAKPKAPSAAVNKSEGANRYPPPVGFEDKRFDIVLPEGFEIFRTYKGTEFRARAVGGKWLLANDQSAYPSLNQLSRAVSGNVENAWRNWYFTGKDSRRHLVEKLRNDQFHHARDQI